VLAADQVQHEVGDEFARGEELGGRGQHVTVGVDRGGGDLLLQRGADLGLGPHVPVQVPGDLRVGLHREQRREIVGGEGSKPQPLGDDRSTQLEPSHPARSSPVPDGPW
jgi:hypothetical protein